MHYAFFLVSASGDLKTSIMAETSHIRKWGDINRAGQPWPRAGNNPRAGVRDGTSPRPSIKADLRAGQP